MKNIELFIFDLDGTLVDSVQDLAESVNFALGRANLAHLSVDCVRRLIGDGIVSLVKRAFEIGGEKHYEAALQVFKDHYEKHLLDTTHLYDGVAGVLEHFSDRRLTVVTNKSLHYVQKILAGLKIDRSFQAVLCEDMGFPKKPAADVILHLLRTFDCDPGRSVIVGDSRTDMQTGRNAGILTCGATYGYGSLEELQTIGYDYHISSPQELIKLFS